MTRNQPNKHFYPHKSNHLDQETILFKIHSNKKPKVSIMEINNLADIKILYSKLFLFLD